MLILGNIGGWQKYVSVYIILSCTVPLLIKTKDIRGKCLNFMD